MPRIAASELADRLTVGAIRLTRTLRGRRPSADISWPEVSALAVIVHGERVTARDLAAYEEVTPATISRVVASLQRKGLVRRTRDRVDGRLYWLQATAAGARRIKEGHEARIAPFAAAIEALPRAQRDTLEAGAEILDGLIARMQRDGEIV